METFKIVLTGGPCSGKTKVLEALKEYYSNMDGVYLRTVLETATELIDAGIVPQLSIDSFSFQDIVFSRQLNKEETTQNYIYKDIDKLKNIIIYDRGLNDNKAYIDQETYDIILDKYNKSEIEILNNYDLVIDLVSTAGSNTAKYETESNAARYESEDEAVLLDKRTTDAWVGHRNIKIIKPTTTILEKIQIVKEEIDKLINNKSYTISRKYILDPESDLSTYKDNNSKIFDEEKIYLDCDKTETYQYVIKKTTYKNKYSYNFTISRNISNVSYKKLDVAISEEKALELIKEFGIIKTINKQVTHFVYDYKKFIINKYDDISILEVELNNLYETINYTDNLIILDDINEDYDYEIKKDKVKRKQINEIIR